MISVPVRISLLAALLIDRRQQDQTGPSPILSLFVREILQVVARHDPRSAGGRRWKDA